MTLDPGYYNRLGNTRLGQANTTVYTRDTRLDWGYWTELGIIGILDWTKAPRLVQNEY